MADSFDIDCSKESDICLIFVQFKFIFPSLMKFEVNSDHSDGKSKQQLYKELPTSNQSNLLSKIGELVQKTNLRIYCSGCELELTREALIITKSDFYCIPCFSNLQEFHAQYMVRSSLRASPTSSEWDLMDEAVLTTALRLWGYSNWNQIKEYMDYNQSAFTLEQIQQHYQMFHYSQPDHLIQFPLEVLPHARPHVPYGEVALTAYEQQSFFQQRDSSINRKDSKCEKKPSSNRNIMGGQTEGGLKPSSGSMGEMTIMEAQNRLLNPEKKNECPVLGYNPKRKEFQTWYFDPEAEKLLDELQFYESDTAQEYGIKIKLIQQYNRRLDERAKRKEFALQYKLLDSHYQFSLKPDEQRASLLFQPFMRYTTDHEQYRHLIDTFTTLSRDQSFIRNLMKIRGTVHSGTIEQSYDFLLEKRKKSIKSWEENYNKTYPDKRRRKVYRKNIKQDGVVVLIEDRSSEDKCPISMEKLLETIDEVRSKGSLQSSELRAVPLSQMEIEEAS